MALSRKQLGYGKGGAFGGGRLSTTRRKSRSGQKTYKYAGTYKGSISDAQNIEAGRLNAVGKGAPPEVLRLKRQAARQIRAFKQAQRAVAKYGKSVTGPLTEGQKIFVSTVAKETGLSPRVIAAQVLAEQSGSAATQREAESNHNWLNIGYFDSGPQGSITNDRVWSNPRSAGKATAAFFKGTKFGASQGIRNIVSTAGQSDAAQMNAIVNSGWASSGYGGTLQGTYSQVGVKAPKGKKVRQAKQRLAAQGKILSKSGINIQKAKASPDPLKLRGPYDGSREMVSQLLGQKVRGDKEAGHSPTGYHSIAGAYAQDIGSAGGNASEGEAGLGYNQATLNKIVKNLRKKGAKVPDLKLGDNWDGNVKGYNIELITELHGSGYHIHLGAKWNGTPTSGGIVSGGGSYSGGGSGATVVSGQAGNRKNRIVSQNLSGQDLLGFIDSLKLGDISTNVFDSNINVSALKQLSGQPKNKVSSVKAARKKGVALQIAREGAQKFGLTITSTTGGSHVPGSYHYSGRGVDIAGSAKQMRAFFNWASRYRPTELFYDPAGFYWKNGKKIKGAIGGHSDHVHIAM